MSTAAFDPEATVRIEKRAQPLRLAPIASWVRVESVRGHSAVCCARCNASELAKMDLIEYSRHVAEFARNHKGCGI